MKYEFQGFYPESPDVTDEELLERMRKVQAYFNKIKIEEPEKFEQLKKADPEFVEHWLNSIWPRNL